MWFEWHSIVLEAVWVAILFQCLLGYREGRGEPTPGVVALLLFLGGHLKSGHGSTPQIRPPRR
jgi:hypothetical protein